MNRQSLTIFVNVSIWTPLLGAKGTGESRRMKSGNVTPPERVAHGSCLLAGVTKSHVTKLGLWHGLLPGVNCSFSFRARRDYARCARSLLRRDNKKRGDDKGAR